MITIFSLWMPILVASVIVFVASSIVWMVLPHHKKDFARVPDEGALRNALRGIAPGAYVVPHLAGRLLSTGTDHMVVAVYTFFETT